MVTTVQLLNTVHLKINYFQIVTAEQLGEVHDKLASGNDEGLRYVLDLKASA